MPRPPMLARVLIVCTLATSWAFAQVPPVVFPPQNAYSADKAVLGKILFWEEQMSSDDTTACGTCHISSVGGGDPRTNTPQNTHPGPDGMFLTGDDIQGSRGVVRCDPTGPFSPEPSFFPNAQVTRRKSPSFIGAGWAPELFWDGRAHANFVDPVTQVTLIPNFAALESQAVGPIVSDVEMACQLRTHVHVASKIANVRPMKLATNLPPDISAQLALYPTYPQLFQAAFGDPAVTAARIGMAIATYERTLVPDQTPWDAFQAGNTSALTASQQAGLTLFLSTQTNCAACHIPPLFTDHSFANIGVRPDTDDPGRFEVTGLNADKGKFRVPSLRNVGLRAPFFHNGGKANMNAVVLFYKLGGDFPGPNLDFRMGPLTITHTEELALADFVQNGLTDPRVTAQTYPFDRPTLNSEIPGNFPVGYGYGSQGTGNIAPIVLAPQTAYLGNHQWVIALAQGLGGSPAALAFSAVQAPPGWTFGPNPLWVNPNFLIILVDGIYLGGTPGAAGAGTFSIVVDLPYDPILSNLTVYAQGAVADPLAPGGLAVTAGSQITLVDFGP
jgi:cytochrome c peroxidase